MTNALQADSFPLIYPIPAAGIDSILLHRMRADYADWLQFLAQADSQSNGLKERLIDLGRRGWWDWVLARSLRYHVGKRNRMLVLIRPVIEQAHAVLEQALTDPRTPLTPLNQLAQIHPYTRLHMAEMIRLLTHIDSQYRSLR